MKRGQRLETGNGVRARMLQFILAHTREKGYPPTLREIGGELFISSTAAVSHHIDVLVDKELIVRDFGISRGIKVVSMDAARQFITEYLDNGTH